ncbi:hypothetical protein SISNIDRAFT_56648 [Sistotremastrum niveocremeum HHB9708]|uniref:Uncharacterized protein n=1 Tax=Sistotremastrum niveocremeum HHB9708 TaxID=1314777 RepID=A0A164VDH3_9AGAM|nr:hypothetical protein SISNIDRAFT_56648 [Sistotremastrum niveocremeum HHB9708]
MPPKNKGKKGKKGDDEDFWEKAGESVASKLKDVSLDDEPVPGPARKSAFGGFAALSMTADAPEEDEDEEQGGLMSLMKVAKSKKDKKKNKRDAVTFEDGPAPGEGSEGEEQAAKGDISKSKKAVEMTAEELADEEWGPSSTKDKKGKKGKKGKKNAAAALDEDLDDTPATEPVVEPPETVEVETKKGPAEMTAEELADEEFGPIKPKGKKGKKGAAKEEPAASPAPAAETAAVEEEDEEDQPTTKVLSKKEKEKLKKEREKASSFFTF